MTVVEARSAGDPGREVGEDVAVGPAVDKKAALDVLDFWDPLVNRGREELILDPDEFYILVSDEAVHVPPTHAAEMVPFDPLVGEFRVHYAGFFDPGFGHSSAGGTGSRAVLEVRSREVPFLLPWDDRQQAMSGTMDLLYRLDGQIWIADYKTDSVKSEDVPSRVELYRTQAGIYKAAVARLLDVPSVSFQFIFLRPGLAMTL